MNERIKELAEQAEEYADSMVDEGSDFHPEYTQKFAELLLKECIDTAFHRGHPDLEFLLKHFGVE